MTILEQDRARRQLEKHRSSQDQSGTLMDNTAPIQLLVEIVSINGIKKHVTLSVSIKMGGHILHRTDYVNSHKGSIIFTLNDGCFFLLEMKMLELFSSGGITFLIRTEDSMALKGDTVGRITVPLERILSAKGERDSFNVSFTGSDEQQAEEAEGNLCIRFRRVTSDDVQFMTEYRIVSKKKGVFSEETFLWVRPPPRGLGGMKFSFSTSRQLVATSWYDIVCVIFESMSCILMNLNIHLFITIESHKTISRPREPRGNEMDVRQLRFRKRQWRHLHIGYELPLAH